MLSLTKRSKGFFMNRRTKIFLDIILMLGGLWVICTISEFCFNETIAFIFRIVFSFIFGCNVSKIRSKLFGGLQNSFIKETR